MKYIVLHDEKGTERFAYGPFDTELEAKEAMTTENCVKDVILDLNRYDDGGVDPNN